METSAKVIADSCWEDGSNRLTTLQLRFPRIILPEFNTHRVFSRNASSSRAIPVAKKLEQARTKPFLPKYLLQNKKGMQGGDAVDAVEADHALFLIQNLRDAAVDTVSELADIGLAKQVANRYLEPWDWTEVVVTSTDWSNFFALRIHEAAEPHMRELAQAMLEAIRASTPSPKTPGQWHLPYLDEFEAKFATAPMRSSARCARVSYNNHDGTPTTSEEDLALYKKLVSNPVHGSALEHAARVPYPYELMTESWRDGDGYPRSRANLIPKLRSNLWLWVQYRKTIANENNSVYHEFER